MPGSTQEIVQVPDSDDIAAAVEEFYPKTSLRADGYLVIDRKQTIQSIDLGAQRLLAVKSIQGALGYRMDPFLPPEYPKDRHWKNVEQKFLEFEEALESPELKTFEGRFMATQPDSQKPKYISAITLDNETISIGIEFQPLLIVKKPNKYLYMIAFIYRDPNDQADQRPITASESTEMLKSGKAALAMTLVDEGGRRFRLGFYFLRDEVFKGYPGASLLSFLILGGLCVSVGFTAYMVLPIPGRKPPVIQHIEQNFSTDDQPPAESNPKLQK